jgi:hypothetical protein
VVAPRRAVLAVAVGLEALEDVVVEALPTDVLQQFIELASAEFSEEGVLSSVQKHIGEGDLVTLSVSDWLDAYGEHKMRSAIAAAAKGGVPTIALRCGGWWDDLALGGAVAIYNDPADLLAGYDESPLSSIEVGMLGLASSHHSSPSSDVDRRR